MESLTWPFNVAIVSLLNDTHKKNTTSGIYIYIYICYLQRDLPILADVKEET